MIPPSAFLGYPPGSERLQVGIGAVHGLAGETPLDQAVKELVASAIRTVNIEQLLARGVVLLATGDWCRGSPELPRAVRRAIQERLGYPAPLIGGSMAKMFCLADPNPVIDPGLVLIALFSNDLHITVGKLEKPHHGPAEQRQQRLQAMAQDLEARAGVRLGSGAERFLFGILPGIVSDDRGRRAYGDSELHQEILAAFGFHYRLIGGAAADGIHPKTGYQFLDDECLESSIVLALIESELSTGSMMGHGFSERRELRVSVDGLADGTESGYDVSLLDNKSASERLAELNAKGLLWSGRPIFGIPDGPDSDVVLVLSAAEGGGGPIRLTRKVSRGDRLYLLDATTKQMLESGRSLIDGAQEDAGAELNDLAVVLAFVCIGRFAHYEKKGEDWRQRMMQICSVYPGVPVVAALGAGEFGMDRWHRSRANNMSVSLCCLTTKSARRTLTRKLERTLLQCANRLMLCKTPKAVVEAALRGAIEAGAIGGQVCLVDYAIGRIVGGELGCAFQPSGSSQNWTEVAKRTDRPASDPVGGDFPSDLRAWSRPVKPDVPLKLVPKLLHEEDILTLIVRTLQAVFVTDTHDPRFACDVGAADAGNVRAHLAIPMVDSRGKALATLQVGFQDETIIDRESLDAWVGYAQKAAVALERAQESGERELREDMEVVANEIMQGPMSSETSPTAWCTRYLDAIMRILGADGCHIRLLVPAAERDEYRLAAAVGFLADLRFQTRPVTHEGDGSCNRQLLLRGGMITNTKQETGEFNKRVESLQGGEASVVAFRQKLDEIEATAMLPLVHQDTLLGSFVIDSRQRYFFTERSQRLAENAARLAASLLAAKTDAFYRVWLANEQRWVLETLSEATQASAGQRLRWFVERLCDALNADVASVFIWHETPKRFILHTAHNWAVPMEGKAEYALGEGWTGSLPYSLRDVSIAYPGSAEANRGTKKYYNATIPLEYQDPESGKDARIGLRLGTNSRPVAAITFAYYPQNADRLVAENTHMAGILHAFGPLLTLAVEGVRQEAAQRQVREMTDAKDDVVAQLMAAVQPDGTWQPVVDAIRVKFCVERATFYPLVENRLSAGVCSPVPDAGCAVKSPESLPIFGGALRDVVYRKETIHVAEHKDRYLLAGWPSPSGIRTLLALPVVCTEGQVRGVLELVNRVRTPDHPHEAFASYERRTAQEVARALGNSDMIRAKQLEADELRTKLETATLIGAASLSGALIMHRLMTPFALIQSSVDWLRLHPGGPPDDRTEHLDRVQASCSEAVTMIQRASQRGTFEKRTEKVRTLVKQALRAVQPETSALTIRLNVVNTLAVPVYVEPYSIVSALINLLANAMDAMGGRGTLNVATDLASDEQHAVIRIRNTGAIVTPEQIEKFFRPGHSTKDRERHLGFGLPIAKRAIEDAGGALDMVPVADGGVEAHVLLPLAQSGGSHVTVSKGENP